MRAEVVIIGAGVIGSALAMGLTELGVTNVIVIDPDLEGKLSSSELNAGGVRATFHQEINILASIQSIDYFARHATEVGYRSCGYLWLHEPKVFEEKLRSQKKWASYGWEVQAWTPEELRTRRPFIDRVDDLGGALFAPRDGLLNPNLLKLHFRNEAKKRGARFLDRHSLRTATISSQGIELECEKESEKIKIQCDRVVNCAGAWAGEVARILGYSSPAYAVRRQVSIFDCKEVDLSSYGMIIDSSGVYFHSEATHVLSGIAVRDEPHGVNFDYDGEAFFQEKIWTPLAERSSKFQTLKHITGWSGLYEVSPDESAMIGEVTIGQPKGTGRVFESHSYSGHGVMHSYATGRALAHKIIHGKYKELDLSILSGERFETGALVPETAVI